MAQVKDVGRLLSLRTHVGDSNNVVGQLQVVMRDWQHGIIDPSAQTWVPRKEQVG
jgi:hypothetical protein